MSMKLRAVIFRPQHTNDIFTIKKKLMVNETHFRRGNCQYELNDDNFQVTTDQPWWRLWTFKRYFTTYYYAQGKPKPLPVPLFEELGAPEASGLDLVDGEALANMFEAWLWRTIAAPVRSVLDNMQFYISMATLAGVAYLVWTQLHPGTAPPPTPPTTGP